MLRESVELYRRQNFRASIWILFLFYTAMFDSIKWRNVSLLWNCNSVQDLAPVTCMVSLIKPGKKA